MYGKLKEFLTNELEGIKAAGLYKNERIITTPQRADIKVNAGSDVLNFCANNYLGLSDNQRLIKAAKEAMDTHGYGMSSVRFICGTQDLHKQLEAAISDYFKTEDTILYAACFDANGGLFEPLFGEEDAIISDALNHASIIDGVRLCKAKRYRYANADMADLERCLQEAQAQRHRIIATDGVFSMGGDIAKLPEIVDLAKKYGARVMVDDAHGLGVIGEGGRGTASYFGLDDEVDIIMGTFSKSLASLGGYMAASELVCDYVRHNSRPFIFSASIPPSACATALAALRYIEAHPELPERLLALSSYARKGLKERGLHIRESLTPIIPIYTYQAENTLRKAKELYEAGVYVNPVLPPATEPTECLLRTSYMATHTEALLDEAMDIIKAVLGAGAQN